MRHAFLILAHKNPSQLQKLCDYLLAEDVRIFIHIDKKARQEFQPFILKNKNREGLQIISRYQVQWGSYNQILATFLLLHMAIRQEGNDFISLISAQDLPIKPLKEFNAFLEKYLNQSFLSFQKIPEESDWDGNGGLDRMELFWLLAFPKKLGFIFNRLNVLIHLFQNKLGLRRKVKLQLYGGANWFTLNREMAAYVAAYPTRNPKFLKQFKWTRCADEIIVQTILLNSPFASRIINDCLRFIDWSSGPEYPHVFRKTDSSRVEEHPGFFARKFDEAVDSEIIETIYAKLP